MKPKEISQLIEKEINGDWTISNRHGCNLKKCLIRPKKGKLRSGGEIKDYWIVLEEIPETLEGWKVFFDEKTNKFGLAGRSDPVGYVATLDDTFIAAFKSM
jgi:hypothetical protein